MKWRTPLDRSAVFRPDDPMEQFNCDRLAALDASLHRDQRECYFDVCIVIEIVLMGVKR